MKIFKVLAFDKNGLRATAPLTEIALLLKSNF
jgi:hypothetical protein